MNVTSIKYQKVTPKKKHRGSTLIELAIVLPILLILSLGIVQFGVYMNAAVTLTNLSREGARYAATQPNSDDGIETRIQQVCPASIRWTDIQNNITITPAENSTLRVRPNLITVQITYDMKKKMFLPTTFFGWTVVSPTYTAKAIMMVE